MKIADLWVSLGLKGDDKLQNGLRRIRTSMSDVKTEGLAMKAGILGAVYGLERMMSKSGQFGNSMMMFHDITGIGTKELQQYEYATRQAGGSAGEATSAIKNLQDAMVNLKLKGQLPDFYGQLSKYVGGINTNEAMNPLYMMQKIQEFVQKAPPALTRNLLGGMIPEGVLAAMHKGLYTDKTFAKAPVMSENELRANQQAYIQWSNLWMKIERLFGRMNARHGNQLVRDISMIADQVSKVATSLLKLADNLGAFRLISDAFKGWEHILTGLNYMIDQLNGKSATSTEKGPDGKPVEQKKSFLGKVWGDFTDTLGRIRDIPIDVMTEAKTEQMRLKMIGRRMIHGAPWSQGSGGTVVNQTITHNGDAKDSAAVKNLHNQAAKAAHEKQQAGRRTTKQVK